MTTITLLTLLLCVIVAAGGLYLVAWGLAVVLDSINERP